MKATILTSRQFNQDQGLAKRSAESGLVIITDRGKPSFVLLKYSDWESTQQKPRSLAEALAMPPELWGDEPIEFDPPHSRELPREVDLS